LRTRLGRHWPRRGKNRVGIAVAVPGEGRVGSDNQEQMQGSTQRRQGDDEVLQAIRQLTGARPTYGYRRITALLNRARRASGTQPIKRVFRLMRQSNRSPICRTKATRCRIWPLARLSFIARRWIGVHWSAARGSRIAASVRAVSNRRSGRAISVCGHR
jgi:hypothetical protein